MNDEDGPTLASCDSEERRAAAARVMNLLKPVSSKDTKLFNDIDNESDKSSDLPDPFSDDENEQLGMSPRRKRTSDNGACILPLNSLSEEHKRVERLVRLKTNVPDTDDLWNENFIDECSTSEQFVESPEFLAKIDAMVSLSGLDVYLKKKEQEELERMAKKKSKKQITRPSPSGRRTPATADAMDDTSMSGVWRMLEADSPEKGFTISQPGYNVLEDERLEWLRRDDLTWQQRDEAKQKCEKWMKKCNI